MPPQIHRFKPLTLISAASSARTATAVAPSEPDASLAEASLTHATSEAAVSGPMVVASPAGTMTHPARRANADSPTAGEAAATPTGVATTAPSQAAAVDAYEQLQTDIGAYLVTTAAPAASAAVSGGAIPGATFAGTPAESSQEAAAAWEHDLAHECLVSSDQPTPTAEGMQDPDSAQTAVATAVGDGGSPSSSARPPDSPQQRLARDASIAQVLASLNQLPIDSNPGQHAGYAQLCLVSHSELPQQTESTQPKPESMQLPPQQADMSQLSCVDLGELPCSVSATQALSSVSVRPLTQQLSPGELSSMPQHAHAQYARSGELPGVTQRLSSTQLGAVTVGILPSATFSSQLCAGGGVSPHEMEMSMPQGPLDTASMQNTHGRPSVSWLLQHDC